jgi:hypothetical protein
LIDIVRHICDISVTVRMKRIIVNNQKRKEIHISVFFLSGKLAVVKIYWKDKFKLKIVLIENKYKFELSLICLS